MAKLYGESGLVASTLSVAAAQLHTLLESVVSFLHNLVKLRPDSASDAFVMVMLRGED